MRRKTMRHQWRAALPRQFNRRRGVNFVPFQRWLRAGVVAA